VDTVSDPLRLRKSHIAGEWNPGPLGLHPGTLTTRPLRRSALAYIACLIDPISQNNLGNLPSGSTLAAVCLETDREAQCGRADSSWVLVRF
jgi:hypothetical protein